jgi:glycosyltransferase involved in cell wall biosynthesis
VMTSSEAAPSRLMEPCRILVLTNSVDSSGAPIALLRLMRWCVERDLMKPIFVTIEDGDLLEDFQSLGRVYRFRQNRERKAAEIISTFPGGKTVVWIGRQAVDRWLCALCRRHEIEAVYANTASHRRAVSAIAPLDLPVITHVHELGRRLELLQWWDDLEFLISKSRYLFAVSRSVKEMLVSRGASEDRVLEVPGMLEERTPLTNDQRSAIKHDVLHVGPDDLVVAACGFPSLTKGTDVFLRVAQTSLELLPADLAGRVAFRWIGAMSDNESSQVLVDDARRLGLSDRVGTIERIRDADRVLAAVDVVLSPSREDANPLTVIEAAAAARPVVCFSGAGGAEELALAGGALAVPYLDIRAMADTVNRLAISSVERRSLGHTARRIALEKYSPEVVGKRVTDVLCDLAPMTPLETHSMNRPD